MSGAADDLKLKEENKDETDQAGDGQSDLDDLKMRDSVRNLAKKSGAVNDLMHALGGQ